MGRDGALSAARLERLRGVRPLGGWVEDLVDDGDTADSRYRDRAVPVTHSRDPDLAVETSASDTARRRHAVEPVVGPSGRWRWGGIPAGAAVALLGAAVVLALVVGRGGAGAEELVVGPPPQQATASSSTAPPAASGATPVVAAPLGAVPDPASAGPVDPSGEVGAAAGSASTSPLVVHVDGAVTEPGVVVLPPGSRVSDAVSAAGGVTAEADTRLVNLARLLQDGEQVVVPRPGEAPEPPPAGGGALPDSGDADPAAGAAAGGGPVDLNAADLAALDSLPGIGPVLAQRILDHREQQGPFATVEDLGAVSGIGPAVLAGIQDLVTV